MYLHNYLQVICSFYILHTHLFCVGYILCSHTTNIVGNGGDGGTISCGPIITVESGTACFANGGKGGSKNPDISKYSDTYTKELEKLIDSISKG